MALSIGCCRAGHLFLVARRMIVVRLRLTGAVGALLEEVLEGLEAARLLEGDATDRNVPGRAALQVAVRVEAHRGDLRTRSVGQAEAGTDCRRRQRRDRLPTTQPDRR